VRFLIVICLTLLTLPVVAQGTPESVASVQLRAWLSAFNSSDPQVLRSFVQQHYPSRLPLVGADEEFRQQTGGFTLQSVDASSESDKVTGIVKERNSGNLATILIEVEPSEPFNIKTVLIRLMPRTEASTAPHLSQAELIRTIGATIRNEAVSGQFSGAVLLAKNGIPLLTDSGGLADRSRNLPNTVDTKFRIGSMDKMFTAVAVLQLVQAGTLHLSDPVGKFLTDYPNKALASKVTIHHLLTHTGGTGDIFGPEFQEHSRELKTIGDYVRLYGSRPLSFVPGQQYEYSNYGFILLGAIIEKASGEDYYTYVKKHVFIPAGMTSTGFEPEHVIADQVSIGYMHRQTDFASIPNTDTLPYRGTSAGGGYSTVGDLLRFADSLQAGKLLSHENVQLLTTAKVNMPTDHYAYGFEVRNINGSQCFGHDGGAPGMNGDLQICPATGFVVVTLENIDPPAAYRLTEFITSRLPQ
jgi:D-alanyl-D-alanine carboxypeptidase